jgi:D-alanyl-D-alanine carboxypeptidase
MALLANPIVGWAGTLPDVTAQAALVMDASTGRLLWQKNADQKRPPASTTKILTTMLALESGRLERKLPVSSLAQAQAASKLYLRAGDQVELRDLVYALMLKSANDAGVVVAEGLGGSVAGFAAQMNARARKAGAHSSSFRNPHGLPHDQHLSTARDLALILREALQVPGFRAVVSTPSRRIHVVGKKARTLSLRTKNRLLTGYRVPVVGKTGYTRAAGRCFAGAAALGSREVIVVVLGASDLWGDTRKLIEWGLGSTSFEGEPEILEARRVTPPPVVVAAARPKPAPLPIAPATRSESVQTVAARVDSPPAIARPAPVVTTVVKPGPAPAVARTKHVPRVQTARATESHAVVPQWKASWSPTGEVRRGCTGAGCGTRIQQ